MFPIFARSNLTMVLSSHPASDLTAATRHWNSGGPETTERQHTSINEAKARELLETTIRLQLATIIDSVGAKPLLALNDMYALVQYYSETEWEGLNTAMEMLTLQRHLRGLSDETAAPEDARMLALRMALDQATADNKRLKESVASLQEKRRDLGREETQALGRLLRLAAEVAAEMSVPFLGRLPIDPQIAVLGDRGRLEEYPAEEFAPLAERLLEMVPEQAAAKPPVQG